jgi:hypothetical protein
MALEKAQTVDRIEVLETGVVQVRTRTSFIEDGKQISAIFHRHVVAPGNDYAGEEDRVQAICSITHTADVIAAYKAAQGV